MNYNFIYRKTWSDRTNHNSTLPGKDYTALVEVSRVSGGGERKSIFFRPPTSKASHQRMGRHQTLHYENKGGVDAPGSYHWNSAPETGEFIL